MRFRVIKSANVIGQDNAYKTIQPGLSLMKVSLLTGLHSFYSTLLPPVLIFFTFEPLTEFHIADAIEIEMTGNLLARGFKRPIPACADPGLLDPIAASCGKSKEPASIASDHIGTNGEDELFEAHLSTLGLSVVAYTVIVTTEAEVRLSSQIRLTFDSGAQVYYCNTFDEVDNESLCTNPTAELLSTKYAPHHPFRHHRACSTYAIANTDDINYGCPANQQLTTREKLINADNYNCLSIR
ncbi:hypothetical protein Moror_726 [Moniliophthora roreri MCA 2997]|uniref:Uncharacterized protein n=1 Tax=Moniliophthora roreri (strain MCA 2997) TaxID=1381753 RepID=V2XAX3_MONRO|nr:hypothetical protein Moror_726 [Moniliophthora roreri MCA 2997]